jgi:succinyl-diaminopimelate desuccinylase
MNSKWVIGKTNKNSKIKEIGGYMKKSKSINRYKELIDSYQEMLESLQDCLRIKSVSGSKSEIQKALQYYLDLAKQMGFKAKNINNLGGIVEYGEGEKTLGIAVHLDVVPEGSGWTFPAYEGQIKDGKIYGRGAMDNKGPAIAVLYALKALKEGGKKPNCKIQIIIGIDEETIWELSPKLLETITEPDFTIVPDSKFPIVIAEKGLLWLELKKDFKSPASSENQSEIIVAKLQGGDSLNIVPDYCEAVLKIPSGHEGEIEQELKAFQVQNKFAIKLENSNQNLKLLSYGQAAHSFACEGGKNAISQLVLFLSRLEIRKEQKEFLKTYASKIGLEHHGQSLGLAMEDTLTGKLTINPAFLTLDENSAVLRLDIRFPAGEELPEVLEKTNSAFKCFKAEQKVLDSLPSLSFAEDDERIQKLLQVYKDYTGDQGAKPLGMGGTTFAKAFQRAVAFGPAFSGQPKVEHQPDEYIEIEHLKQLAEIYALALDELT